LPHSVKIQPPSPARGRRVGRDGGALTTAAPAIQLEHLGKRYGRVTALRDVSLEVHQGDVFGFLGLNGAGKTTTIRIMLDLVRPTGGRAAVFGADCQAHSRDVRARVGYLPGEPGFYGDMTGEATLDLLGRLGGGRVDPARRRELLDRFELATADLRRRMREYSTGMKRKLGIVQAFQADPPLLVLDEPTEGLDPLMQDVFYDLVAETRKRGRTIFMSSHVLPEVERVCDRIGLLRDGQLVLLATVEEMRALAGRRVRVSFHADVDAPPALPDCEAIEVRPRLWDLRVRGTIAPLVARLGALPVADLDVQMPHLEEILKRYYAAEGRS
jgi:ABC-2 type transport system ATP-binding protein